MWRKYSVKVYTNENKRLIHVFIFTHLWFQRILFKILSPQHLEREVIFATYQHQKHFRTLIYLTYALNDRKYKLLYQYDSTLLLKKELSLSGTLGEYCFLPTGEADPYKPCTMHRATMFWSILRVHDIVDIVFQKIHRHPRKWNLIALKNKIYRSYVV